MRTTFVACLSVNTVLRMQVSVLSQGAMLALRVKDQVHRLLFLTLSEIFFPCFLALHSFLYQQSHKP